MVPVSVSPLAQRRRRVAEAESRVRQHRRAGDAAAGRRGTSSTLAAAPFAVVDSGVKAHCLWLPRVVRERSDLPDVHPAQSRARRSEGCRSSRSAHQCRAAKPVPAAVLVPGRPVDASLLVCTLVLQCLALPRRAACGCSARRWSERSGEPHDRARDLPGRAVHEVVESPISHRAGSSRPGSRRLAAGPETDPAVDQRCRRLNDVGDLVVAAHRRRLPLVRAFVGSGWLMQRRSVMGWVDFLSRSARFIKSTPAAAPGRDVRTVTVAGQTFVATAVRWCSSPSMTFIGS